MCANLNRSWRRVFLDLTCPPDGGNGADYITSFLSQPESVRLLSNCFTPFESPSAKSKSEFESKTAAIHVDTSPQAAYQIDEIKADALWLSQKAGIDEVAALRITVQEWQTRPNTRLVGRFSEEEATSLQDAASVDSFRVSLAGPQLKEVLKKAHGGSEKDFSSEKSRRIRIQNIYLSEKNHIVKTSRKLLGAFLHGKVPADVRLVPLTHDPRQFARDDGLTRLGEQVFESRSGEAESTRFLLDAIKAIENRLRDFQTEGGWLSAAESNFDTENVWRTMLVDEVVHIMQIIYLHVQSCNVVTSGEVVLAWLRLMAEYSFMEPVNPVSIRKSQSINYLLTFFIISHARIQ